MLEQLTYEGLEARIDDDYLVVIGCARSGTQYIAKVFNALGKEVGHWNALGKDGISSDLIIPWACVGEGLTIHQIRDPLKQIGSMQTTQNYTWQYISRFLSIKGGENLLSACMKYWLAWNRIAEKQAIFSYRLENIEKRWHDITEVLLNDSDVALPDVSKTTNSRAGKYKPVTWDMLEAADKDLANSVKELAIHYGYEV